MSQGTDSTGTLELGTERVEAFSDAVIAVIITIMAFSLRPPDGVTWAAIRSVLPGYLVYVISFVFIAIYWNNHHHLLRAADRINGSAMWANMLLLFWLSLIPVVTLWVRAEYRHSLPAAAYNAVGLLAAISYGVLVRALIRANGMNSALARAIGADAKGYLSLGLYATGIGLSFVSPWLGYATIIVTALIWFIPDRRFTRS